MPALRPAAVADAARYLDTWLAFRQRYERVPGVQAALLHGDDVVLSTAHGVADADAGVPLTTRHLFRIASHSKTFTATAVLQLVERGALRLDDTAGQWLPFLDGTGLESVTIRELMAHGGGVVRDGWDGDFWQLFRPFPDAAELERISADAAAVRPRNERFKYSNVGYSLLGRIVAEAAGRPYAEHVAEHILAPLALADTGPDLDETRAGDYATGHSALGYADRRLPIDHVATGAMAAATGFHSTAADVVRYAAGHFFGDTRLLSDDSKRLMQRTEWKVDSDTGKADEGDRGYGLGLAVAKVGDRRLLGHGGGYPGHITYTLFDPVDRLAVAVLTNAIDGPAQAMATAAVRLVHLAHEQRDEPPGERPDAAGVDLARFRGRFANLWGVFDVVDLGGRLYRIDPTAADPAAEPHHLKVVDERTLLVDKAPGYASRGEPIVYDIADDGSVRSVGGGSGMTSYPIEAVTRAVEATDRVRLGQPLRPPPPG